MAIDLGPGPAVSSRLGYLLKHAMLRLEELNAQALAPLGIDTRELGVMFLLDDGEPSSQQEAARRLGVDRTTMVAVIDTLEAKGLAARHVDAEDRRRNVVELTPRGRAVLGEAQRTSDAVEEAFLSPLGEDAADLRRALQEVLRAARPGSAGASG